MNKKILTVILLVLMIPFVLYACFWVVGFACLGEETTSWIPSEGVWYCDALDIQLSFSVEAETYAVLDDKKVTCTWINNRGATDISVLIQESGVTNYKLGDVVFSGEYVSLTESAYTLKDQDSGIQHVFLRCK